MFLGKPKGDLRKDARLMDLNHHPRGDASTRPCPPRHDPLPAQIKADILPRDVGDAVRSLWRDPVIQEAVRRSREFQFNDSAVYYLNAIDRMSSPPYLPTDQDILCSRVKTTGIMETTFKVGELMLVVSEASERSGSIVLTMLPRWYSWSA